MVSSDVAILRLSYLWRDMEKTTAKSADLRVKIDEILEELLFQRGMAPTDVEKRTGVPLTVIYAFVSLREN